MHCYNCQKFGHVCSNCKHPPRYMWCGGSHLHKEYLLKGSAALIPTCCNYRLVGEKEPPTIEAAPTPGKKCERESRTESARLQWVRCYL
jgi:hypothetical protein